MADAWESAPDQSAEPSGDGWENAATDIATRRSRLSPTATLNEINDYRSEVGLPPLARPDPTAGMGGAGLFQAGMGRGMKRALWTGPQTLLRDVLPQSAAARLGLPTAADLAEQERMDAPLLATRAGRYGEVAGNVAAAVPLAIAPGASTLLGSAAYGTAYGALQPAGSASDRVKNAIVSGVLSGGITGAGRMIPAAWRALVSPLSRSGQRDLALETIARFSGKTPQELQSILSGAVTELVPGAKSTLAEATGEPGIAQLQRVAVSRFPEAGNLATANRTARTEAWRNQILNIAGTPEGKTAAISARNALARDLYTPAFDATPSAAARRAVSPQIKELMGRDSMRTAARQAVSLAREEGESLSPQDVWQTVKGLHYMKKSLDSQIGRAVTKGDDNLARLLTGTKRDLAGVIDTLSPEYVKASRAYAEASKPINRMEVGDYLYNKLFPAMYDMGAGKITPSSYAKAVREGDAMAAKALDFPGAKLKDLLSFDEMRTLDNIGRDAARMQWSESAGKVSGSPTAQYLAGQNMLRRIIGPIGLPEKWTEGIAGSTAGEMVSRPLSFLYSAPESGIEREMGSMLMNPREFSAAVAARSVRPTARIPMSDIGRFALPPLAIGASQAVQQ